MAEGKREQVNYRWDGLNWEFIKGLAELANYAGEKYASPEQYTEGRLEGEKSPINHAYEHLRSYIAGEKHDHFGTVEAQLFAVAYNAMMEFYYLTHGGATVKNAFAKKEEPVYDFQQEPSSIIIPVDTTELVHQSLLDKFFGGWKKDAGNLTGTV